MTNRSSYLQRIEYPQLIMETVLRFLLPRGLPPISHRKSPFLRLIIVLLNGCRAKVNTIYRYKIVVSLEGFKGGMR